MFENVDGRKEDGVTGILLAHPNMGVVAMLVM